MYILAIFEFLKAFIEDVDNPDNQTLEQIWMYLLMGDNPEIMIIN